MAIDTSPATVATNALQGLPFVSLIGGPLEAAIRAQAMAAMNSADFIRHVRFRLDPSEQSPPRACIECAPNADAPTGQIDVPLVGFSSADVLAAVAEAGRTAPA